MSRNGAIPSYPDGPRIPPGTKGCNVTTQHYAFRVLRGLEVTIPCMLQRLRCATRLCVTLHSDFLVIFVARVSSPDENVGVRREQTVLSDYEARRRRA